MLYITGMGCITNPLVFDSFQTETIENCLPPEVYGAVPAGLVRPTWGMLRSHNVGGGVAAQVTLRCYTAKREPVFFRACGREKRTVSF